MAKLKEFTMDQMMKEDSVKPNSAEWRERWKFQAKRNGVRYYVKRSNKLASSTKSGKSTPAKPSKRAPATSGRKKSAASKKKKK